MEEFVELCLRRWLKDMEKYARQYVIDYVMELCLNHMRYFRVIVIGSERMEMNLCELTRSHVKIFKWHMDNDVLRVVGTFTVEDYTKEEAAKNVIRKNASVLERKDRILKWRQDAERKNKKIGNGKK